MGESKKLVQEISERGDEVPEIYIQKDGFPEAIDEPQLWNHSLLIDFSLLSSCDAHELAKLRSALSNWGCFQVINHEMGSSFLEELLETSKQFFALPMEEKLKSTDEEGDKFHGYGSDSNFVGTQSSWNDRLYLTLFPKEKCKLQLWPQIFRENLGEFAGKLNTTIEGIYKAMARSLNLEEGCFLNQMKQSTIFGRLSMYPRCSCPERVLGLRPHSDVSTITLLLPEPGVVGLQIQKDHQWFNVPVIPGALFVNLGDFGEVMSNGIFKSAVHRVVTNSAKDRLSWAAFNTPGDGIQIGPFVELITADHPQMYKEFNMNEFMPIYVQNTAAGLRPLDGFII